MRCNSIVCPAVILLIRWCSSCIIMEFEDWLVGPTGLTTNLAMSRRFGRQKKSMPNIRRSYTTIYYFQTWTDFHHPSLEWQCTEEISRYVMLGAQPSLRLASLSVYLNKRKLDTDVTLNWSLITSSFHWKRKIKIGFRTFSPWHEEQISRVAVSYLDLWVNARSQD